MQVIDTWFTVQATSSLPGAAQRLTQLMAHESFSLTNPNKVRVPAVASPRLAIRLARPCTCTCTCHPPWPAAPSCMHMYMEVRMCMHIRHALAAP